MSATMRFEGEGFRAFNLMLQRFQINFNDSEQVFEAIADHQMTVWQKQFDQEGAYTGPGTWSALSPNYGAWKQRHYPGKKILELTGDLRESLTERPFGVDEINDHVMVIGTAVPYSAFHQNGTETMPARRILETPPERDRLQYAKYLQNWIVKRSVT
ncbi:minor tail protein [Arthrobacter phage Chocolat]|uniref:Minor tail protein n=8 Tax=Klausavirus princesstrina TaxID=1984784 RepID=A0A1J0GRP1_9CAUD|nr:tail completion or Neck1 protein [Arthrobacter phage PrincessTrina]AOZ64680.1 minor tail protein [Arthrobacter phage Chocolat]APC44810.1 minor tail protein [Arthrobacter phage HumptyDumpty]ASX98800.1 minor tail protein [Arthrobacter phage Kabreeze]ASX99023.1 minor tail protein [Arthrobacter phage Scavito]ASZ73226.1 minor tail protein [Arthrobacter phage JayCookie]QEQ94121.1 minor tail protein [Arthrobacter phage Mordred]QEQ94516.1 minor tail protein [Arthrobacter phage Linus]